MANAEKLLYIINQAPHGIRTVKLRSVYRKEYGQDLPVENDRELLIQLRKEKKIKFITEPWHNSCWVVKLDYQDKSDYPKKECELFW